MPGIDLLPDQKPGNRSIFFRCRRSENDEFLSCPGRPNVRPSPDRVFHVLVSPEFESCRDFYYPPKISKEIELKDAMGHPYYKKTGFARINLVHIPFVTIRDQLSTDMLKVPRDPATLMMSLVKEERFRLCVNMVLKKLIYKNIELDMMPAHLALYAFFAMQKKNCPKETEICGDCTDCFLDIHAIYGLQEDITKLYKKVSGSRPIAEMSDTGIKELNMNNFNSYKSKIRSELLKRFGLYAIKDLEITSVGKKPNKRHGILMDKSKIEVVI